MIATLLMLAAVETAAPAMDDFKALCVSTRGDVAAVTAAAAARGTWGVPAQQDGMTAWTHTGAGVERILVAGEQVADGAARQACMITTRPVQSELAASAPTALGGVTMPVDAAAGLYAHAPSTDAYRAGDVTFISITSDAESTSLTAIRNK